MPARTSGSNKGCVQKRRTRGTSLRLRRPCVHLHLRPHGGVQNYTCRRAFLRSIKAVSGTVFASILPKVVLSGRESAVRVARTLPRTTPRTLKVQRTSSRVTGPGEHNLNSYLSMHGHGGMSSNGARLLWLYQRSGASSSVTVLEYWCRKSP